MLGAIALAVGVPYFYLQIDEKIRCRVLQRIARHYPGLKVTVRAAELVEGEGIKVRDLSIVDPQGEGPSAELLHIGEMVLKCETDLRGLITEEPPITHITLRRPKLRAARRADGTWSFARLLPLPKCGDCPPPVVIEDGIVEIVDSSKGTSGTLALRDIDLKWTLPDPSDAPGQSPHLRKLEGTFRTDHLDRVKVTGWVDSQRQAWSVEGTVEGLEISPELREVVPEPLAEKLAVLGELRGRATVGFRLGSNGASQSPYQFELAGQLQSGRIVDPRLPDPLTEVQATVRLNNEGLHVDELTARCGPATIRLSVHRAGFEPDSPFSLVANVRQLELDRRLLDFLPGDWRARLQPQWDKYDPAGPVDLDVNLAFDGQTWRPEVAMRCLDVSFCYHKFRYRLEHATGMLRWQDDVLWTEDLTARSGDRPIRIRTVFRQASSAPFGRFEAWGEEVPFDAKLLAAIAEPSREVVRSLNLGGTFDFYWLVQRDAPDQPMRKEMVVQLGEKNRCTICYELFPYPVDNVCGKAVMRDDDWTFQDLKGINDSARITCEGRLDSPARGGEMLLRFTAADVRLDEELRNAFLRESIRRAWDTLKPQGKIDLDEVAVHRPPGQKQAVVSVRARPKDDTVSIEPVRFPFRLEKVQCGLTYGNGHVAIERLKAEHGTVKIAAGRGDCEFLADGNWSLALEGLSVDRLQLEDRDFIQAVPDRLKQAIAALKPTGGVHLRGAFALQGGSGETDPVHSSWDLEIVMHQGTLDCGVTLEDVYGSVTLVGAYDGERFYSHGELDIDSASWLDFQFTRLMGPLWIDDRQVLLGSWVGRRENELARQNPARQPVKPRPLSARLFGGNVWSDAWVSLDSGPRYGFHATLSEADLARFAQEVMAGRQNLKGKITATIDLGGTGRNLNGMGGRGQIWLGDADIWELPLMIELLSILSLREPDRTAFSNSDIVFDIRGNHIYFEKINFNGDAISLLGQGEMDFDSNVALRFQPILGRNEWELPGFSEIFRGAGRQIMQIRVDGTLQEPKTKKEFFPAVNQAQLQLQRDLKNGTAPDTLLPPLRSLIPHVGSREERGR
ncbi:MAG TPA: hypothetical protein VMY42_18750 [Thermoguttaceae bacterium]|nr:hypothetical protein [Thermoguttaceae bacterium]